MSDDQTPDKFDEIAAALPGQVRQAVRDYFKDDANAHLLEPDRAVGGFFDAVDEESRNFFYDAAGIDAEARSGIEARIAEIRGAHGEADKPKREFNGDAPEDGVKLTDGDKDHDVSAAGAGDSDEPEDGAEIRREKFRKILEESNAEDERRKAAGKGGDPEGPKAAFQAGGGDDGDQEGGQKMYDVSGLGRFKMVDRGDYIRMKGQGGRNRQMGGTHEVTDRQLRMLMLTCILNKGWTDITFYRGGRVDSQLTTRAKVALVSDSGLINALEAAGVDRRKITLNTTLGENPPPWAQGGLGAFFHGRRFKAQQKAIMRASKRAEWETQTGGLRGGAAPLFSERESGKTLAEDVAEDQAKKGKQDYGRHPGLF